MVFNIIIVASAPLELATSTGVNHSLSISGAGAQAGRGIKGHLRASAAAPARMQARYDRALAPFYMWSQTEFAVYVAVHLPIGAGEGILAPITCQ